ncbi:MAG: MarR family transcriptional regulator [Atopobiaceae bacterium]
MELREFISIRRAYNLVRQNSDPADRLTFECFAILCHLFMLDAPIKTSEVADYQKALRPTITHRMNLLAKHGFIDRQEGADDRRNIVCFVTEDGKDRARLLAKRTAESIANGQALARTSPDRIIRYADAMGSVPVSAGDMLMLVLLSSREYTSSVSGIVDKLGLLQPTVSMSISSLVDEDLIERQKNSGLAGRSTSLRLTADGVVYAEKIADSIAETIVRRKPRKKQDPLA